jgi:hypothetical protein
MTTVILMLTNTPMSMVLKFMMSTMTMSTTNSYHYPKQKYDGEWPQHHYGTDIQAPSQSVNENEGETNEALMLEKDDDNVVYDDGFDQ